MHLAMLHFMSGLPRSGSTALISLLSQNPRIHGGAISGLCGIFGGVYANWDKDPFHQEMAMPASKKAVLATILDSYHSYSSKPVVVDKNRQWSSHIALLESVLGRSVKIIVPVRPVVEILASFETLRTRNPLDLTLADAALGSLSTLETRANYFMTAEGAIGAAYNSLRDAVVSGYLDRMLFVDYNKLMNTPLTELRRIYSFLNEPYFDHDLSLVVRSGESNSLKAHHFRGLHDVRPRFERTSRSPIEVLGPELYQKYLRSEPWEQWT